jgi:hypothetical protein
MLVQRSGRSSSWETHLEEGVLDEDDTVAGGMIMFGISHGITASKEISLRGWSLVVRRGVSWLL